MGALTPETCRVILQWNKSDCILLHLVGLLFNVSLKLCRGRNRALAFAALHENNFQFVIIVEWANIQVLLQGIVSGRFSEVCCFEILCFSHQNVAMSTPSICICWKHEKSNSQVLHMTLCNTETWDVIKSQVVLFCSAILVSLKPELAPR